MKNEFAMCYNLSDYLFVKLSDEMRFFFLFAIIAHYYKWRKTARKTLKSRTSQEVFAAEPS